MNDKYDEISTSYHDLPTIRAIVQLIPHVGGSLDTLLASRAEKLASKRIEKFIDETKQKLDNIDESKIDKEFIRTEEFEEVLRDIINKVKQSFDVEKIKLLSNAFKNSILVSHAKDPLTFTYIEILHVLSITHIVILRFFYDNSSKNINEQTIIANAIQEEGISKDESELIIDDLLRLQLLHKQGIGTYGAGGGWNEISRLGRSFIQFISEY